MNIKLIGALGGAAILILAAFLIGGRGISNQGGPVAIVNGETITRQAFNEQLDQTKSMYAAQGIDASTSPEMLAMLEQEVLDGMVNEILLMQRAQQEIETQPTEEDVENQYRLIAEQFSSEEEFLEQLAAVNMDKADVHEALTRQLVIERYIEQYLQGRDVDVTEDEVEELYSQYTEDMDDAPTLDEIRDEILAELRQEKEHQAILALIEDLKAEGDIQILL